MTNYIIYGPVAGGLTVFGPVADGTVVYGTSTQGATPDVDNGTETTYEDIVNQIAYEINNGTPGNISDIITPDNVVIVQNNNGTNDDPGIPTNDISELLDIATQLQSDLEAAESVAEVLPLFTSTNAAAAELLDMLDDRVMEYEGFISDDTAIQDHIDEIDDEGNDKPNNPC